MRKLFLLLIAGLSASYVHAIAVEEFNYIPLSSYTEATTAGPVLFASAPLQLIGVSVSSPVPNSYVTFWRSTSPAFTTDITTQTVIYTGWNAGSSGPAFMPMFEVKNASYTYFQKVGAAQVTIWFRGTRKGMSEPGIATFPGLGPNGK